MYLKEIEIQGFKSFADKTKVKYHGELALGPGGIQCQESTWGQDARCHLCRDRIA